MTAEKRLKELYRKYEVKVVDCGDGRVAVRDRTCVQVAPQDIDLIADLIVERMKEGATGN